MKGKLGRFPKDDTHTNSSLFSGNKGCKGKVIFSATSQECHPIFLRVYCIQMMFQ